MRLAGQHEAGRDLVLLEREVALHPHLPFEQLGPARAADARLARERHLEPGGGGGVEDVALLGVEVDLAADAVADDRDARVGGVALARRLHRATPGAGFVRDAEALDVDPLRRQAGSEQRRLGLVVDAVRAADEGVVDVAGVDERGEELADLVAAEAAVVERQVGRLLREHHVQRQARQVAVLEVLDLLGEHRRALLAVAVDQREARLRLGAEDGLHDRQDRRDAAAAGDAEVVARRARVERNEEAPLGRHHLQRVAGLERVVDPGREDAARHLADADAQLAVGRAGADRVRAALLAAGDDLLQRQVLALGEAELLGELGRDVERDDDRLFRFGSHALDAQGMEMKRHG